MAKSKLYILGHPVSHSKSPIMYNTLYSKIGLDWEYLFADIDEKATAEKFLADRDFLSINITTPYKPEAYEAADLKAATAQLARGVNLLVNVDGNLIGFNVDGQGCISFLEREGVDFRGKSVVVCGSGPTSLSILNEAAQAGSKEVIMLGRDKERVSRVIDRYLDDYQRLVSSAIDVSSATDKRLGFTEAYEKVDFKYGAYGSSKGAISKADIIIDATSLGMNEGDPAPFDVDLLNSDQVVMDTVYGHGVTKLISSARALGCAAYDGAGMLVAQAVISATTTMEINDVDPKMDFDTMFELMKDAAGFTDIK